MNDLIQTNKLSKRYGNQTGATTLEEAFITLTGGTEQRELLAWREQNAT